MKRLFIPLIATLSIAAPTHANDAACFNSGQAAFIHMEYMTDIAKHQGINNDLYNTANSQMNDILNDVKDKCGVDMAFALFSTETYDELFDAVMAAD